MSLFGDISPETYTFWCEAKASRQLTWEEICESFHRLANQSPRPPPPLIVPKWMYDEFKKRGWC